MKTLSLKLRKNGFEYIQVLRGRRSCIYRQEGASNLTYFEVFLIKVKPARVIKGKKIPAREYFPPDKAFGVWAWSFKSFDTAFSFYQKIEKEVCND